MTTFPTVRAPRISGAESARSALSRLLRPRSTPAESADERRVRHQLRRENRRELEKIEYRTAYLQQWSRR